MTAGSRRRHWLGLVVLLLLALAVVAIPMYLIQPFAAQSPGEVGLSFALRRWSPLVTLAAVLTALWFAMRLWRDARIPGRIVASLLVAATAGLAWLSRQNHFEWMFAPLPEAGYTRAGTAREVAEADMVLAVLIKGDAVAYPVRQLAYHHLVNDQAGGIPIVATY
jgi:hypothetical protein